ncbi:hypothetical protein O9992_19965 [Vibrio lentus]|nr:hypothetical protein [Vibrio lentus]
MGLVELSAPPYFIETAASWNGVNSVHYRDEWRPRQLQNSGWGWCHCHSEFIITDWGRY